ncbi:hypothetical protein A374_18054 [Fictibacillus macauensis ZFHKF-1]|uniref:Uncharacterized protein n=1 Tax=Fictibacillus macauensis ZFHKF-1 TaxID=1196324 RepID=I8AF51_9BACL|nr:hypothetical protein [Fictibacillus macauensis]EIT83964.1 hypothetical protein A374_18054 [Fictibacillus macauensis ZFHKF-1]
MKWYKYFLVVITIVSSFSVVQAEAKSSSWSGEWNRSSYYDGGSLVISRETANSFHVSVSVVSGGHAGYIEGKATYRGNIARLYDTEYKSGCILTFKRTSSHISLQQNQKCAAVAGNGTHFSGEYKKGKVKASKPSLQGKATWLTAAVDQKFRKLTGRHYDMLAESFQLYHSSYDSSLGAYVVSGGVRGLYTIMEGIVMKDRAGYVYAAHIQDGDKVYYYTSNPTYKHKLPRAVNEWRSRFSDYPVSYFYK